MSDEESMSDELREMSDEALLAEFQDAAETVERSPGKYAMALRDEARDELLARLERGRKAEEALVEIWAIATDAKNSNTPQATAINRIYEIADRILGGEKKEGE